MAGEKKRTQLQKVSCFSESQGGTIDELRNDTASKFYGFLDASNV